MPLRIVGRRKDVSQNDREFIEQKVERLRRVIDQISVLDVFIDEVRHNVNVLLVLKAGALELSAEKTDKSVRTAFDQVLHKIERRLKKEKGKKWGNKKHLKRGARAKQHEEGAVPSHEQEEEEPPPPRQIINVERVPFKPMSVEEAAEQIEVNESSVLVFINDISERINVLYSREDGHYGLIEPE
jgi:putative sigma-54 modulation protein